MNERDGKKLFDALAALFQAKGAAGADAPFEDYAAFLALTEPDGAELEKQREYAPSDPVRFILTVAGGGRAASATVASIEAQTYRHFELTGDPFCAEGDYVIVLDAGDVLTPDALYRFAKRIGQEPGAKLLYANEDRMGRDGRTDPMLKCDYDEVTALSYDLFGAPVAVSKAVFDVCAAPGVTRAPDAAGRYAYALRCLAKTGGAAHIDRVLLTAAQGKAPVSCGAGSDAVSWYLHRTGQDCTVSAGLWQGSFRVAAMSRRSRTAIVIPNRDGADALRRLLESIEETCMFYEPEIIIADGGSTSERTKRYYEILEKNGAADVVRVTDGAAGFSRLCNAAAERAAADELFFLSRDAELVSPDAIGALRAQALRRKAGAVGCIVADTAGRLLHDGYVAGLMGGVACPYEGDPRPAAGDARKLRFTQTVRGVSAVSGAALFIRADVFHSAGGFDESFDDGSILPCAADAELCVRLMRRGLTNIFTPYAEVIFNGSLPRIEQAADKVKMRAYDALRPLIVEGDPYFSGGYSLRSTTPRVRVRSEDEPPDAF